MSDKYQRLPNDKDDADDIKVEIEKQANHLKERESNSELQTGPAGLQSAEATRRFNRDGANCLPEKRVNPILKFLSYYWGPMPCMIWVAIVIEAIREDWPDFLVLMVLQVVNGLVGYIEEKNAGNAIEALKRNLAPKATVKRDGDWKILDASSLVIGDRINVKLGDIIPADAILGAGEPLEIDQAALTGESLPVTKFVNDLIYQGSVCKRGEIECVVYATGQHTFFGKASTLVNSVNQRGNFQKILLKVTFFLMIMSIVLVAGIFVKLIVNDVKFLEVLSFCVVLLVASIPIAMQVVCTSTMAVGSHKLATKQAIVSRLSSIEELAGMNILCSDKTGTLTKNELTLYQPYLVGSNTEVDLMTSASLSAKRMSSGQDAIDKCITDQARGMEGITLDEWDEISFIPFDPVRKRTEATVKNTRTGETIESCKGAPQVILALSANLEEIKEEIEREVNNYASRGFRTLGVARKLKGEWVMQGLLSLFDPPRDDTFATIKKAKHMNISVKMITGDQSAIAKETSKTLELGTRIFNTECLTDTDNMSAVGESNLRELILGADGFAEVFPEHKFFIVHELQKANQRVGMTGDGVNDAPALKRADVGIAVDGATDAARAAADIVLTNPGLSVIIDAIFISRKIFQRMKNYCVYRIACTIQLVVFFFISMIALNPRSFVSGPNSDDTPKYFSMPVIALVIITVLNDGTILTIAYDKVKVSKGPEKWRLVQVCTVASVLGGVACISSIILLVMAFGHLQDADGNAFLSAFGINRFTYSEVMTLMYMKVSVSDFLTVFAARTHGFFWTRRPAMPLVIAFIFSTMVATFFSVYWFIHLKSSGENVSMDPISWGVAAFVWGYNIVWFLLQDVIKVGCYKLYENFSDDDDIDKGMFLGESFLTGTYRDGKFLSKASFMSAKAMSSAIVKRSINASSHKE